MRLLKQTTLFFAAAALTISTLATAKDYGLPALGDPSSQVLSKQQEAQLGKRVISQLYQSRQILQDEELSHYLHKVGERLIRVSGHDPDHFKFFVVDDDSINAFALPGGNIGINSGLITKTQRESELAAVMAHEISHVTQRHIARQLQASQGVPWTILAAILAAAIIGGGGDAIGAAATGSVSMAYNKQLSFTRAHEFEADRVGIGLLADAHYDPNAMASFFATLQRMSRLYGHQLPQILLSHPVTSTRIAEASARAKEIPTPTIHEMPDYPYMKERARVLVGLKDRNATHYYQQLDKLTPAQEYGYALALKESGQAPKAIKILQKLITSQPDQIYFYTALGRAYEANNQDTLALKTLNKAQQRFGQSLIVALTYGQALIRAGKPQKAQDYIKQLSQTPHNAHAQKLLADAAGKQKQTGEHYYHLARYYQLRYNYPPALRALTHAIDSGKLSSLEKERSQALLDRIQKDCQQLWPDGRCGRQ